MGCLFRSTWISLLLALPALAALPVMSVEPGGATPVREADELCAKCHDEIYRHYLATPMANASGLASDRVVTGGFHHSPSGIDYRVSEREGKVWLSYARPDDPRLNGQLRLDYFLGSGHLGITYFYLRNGYLLESPVAYYTDSRSYDMKPGLANVRTMPSALPMTSGCMRCHMSGVQYEDPATRNHFSGLPFLHGGITCESCHGNSRNHVATAGRGAIINPMKLDPERRDSVCISCHLEGATRIEHASRHVQDYKPGERISDYLSYFIYATDDLMSRGVSEIEQLSVSKCKRASGDRMSCMNCHDPHYSPTARERPTYYREKCLMCHTPPKYAQSHFSSTPDCTSCHMPKAKAEKVPHIAWTDHRIRQAPDAIQPISPRPGRELVTFLPQTPSERDLGLAYYDLVIGGNASEMDRAWALLSAAQKNRPDDLPVLTALGYLSQLRGKNAEAMQFYRAALKFDPNVFTAANNLAILLAKSGQLLPAEALWTRTFDLNEAVDEPGINLATAQCMLGNKQASAETLGRVLSYSPDQPVARQKLADIESGKETCGVPLAR